MPVSSVEGPNTRQQLALTFDLGNQPGQNVSAINYDYRWTRSIVLQMPNNQRPATVHDQLIDATSGFFGPGRPPLRPAKPQVGAEALERVTHKNTGFPQPRVRQR